MRRLTLIAAAAVAMLALAMPGSLYAADTIVVGGKNFTEQLIMAEMTKQLLEHNGFEVDKKDGMGSTVLRKAQENGQIDVYWEYTGTSLVTYNKVTKKMSAADTYKTVKMLDAKKGLVWLNPSNANNTYALAVKEGDKKTANLETLSDMAKAYDAGKNLTMAVNAEFPNREDGLIGLQKTYGFKVPRADRKPMDSGLTYQALKEGKVDIALVFATDGRIAAFHFRVLKDDKGFFPNYALCPVIRKDVLDKHPKLADILNSLSSKLDDKTMQHLNAEVDVDKKSVHDVAQDFLKKEGLV